MCAHIRIPQDETKIKSCEHEVFTLTLSSNNGSQKLVGGKVVKFQLNSNYNYNSKTTQKDTEQNQNVWAQEKVFAVYTHHPL